MGFSFATVLEENGSLVWVSLALLVVFVASVVYRSRAHLRALNEKTLQDKQERARNREERGQNPFAGNSAKKNKANNIDEDDTTSDKTMSNKHNLPVKDVWEERRQKGILPSSSSTASSIRQRKPNNKSSNDSPGRGFQSSYYYAHNSTNSKGGYADGLSMEDYTMNGPRLLSKGGKPVVEEVEEEEEEEVTPEQEHEEDSGEKDAEGAREQDVRKNGEQEVSTSTPSATAEATPTPTRFLTISKYLWDDPGDSTGIATIRIDALPNPNPDKKESIPWKDANVQNVSAELTGEDKEGLLVRAQTPITNLSSEEEQPLMVEYRLEIPQLYGEVTSVKAVVKAKRLLVRLQKPKVFWDKSVLKEWPHPHKKGKT